jgi:hypothetical protein
MSMNNSMYPDEHFDRHGTPRGSPAAQWPCKRTASYSGLQRGLALSLVPYVSEEDFDLTREEFLRTVASRIADDLQHGTV